SHCRGRRNHGAISVPAGKRLRCVSGLPVLQAAALARTGTVARHQQHAVTGPNHQGRRMKLAANLSLLYPGLSLARRMSRAAHDGFAGIEILFPYDISPGLLAELLQAHGLELALINTPL